LTPCALRLAHGERILGPLADQPALFLCQRREHVGDLLADLGHQQLGWRIRERGEVGVGYFRTAGQDQAARIVGAAALVSIDTSNARIAMSVDVVDHGHHSPFCHHHRRRKASKAERVDDFGWAEQRPTANPPHRRPPDGSVVGRWPPEGMPPPLQT
jgi:hypothetical protein